jgi:presenilin-like A22 family membrane protease
LVVRQQPFSPTRCSLGVDEPAIIATPQVPPPTPEPKPEAETPMPVTWAEYRATAVLLAFFVANILIAIVFASPFLDAGLQAFEDPDDVGNSLWYIVLILAFTFLILYIAKKGKKWLIRAIILAAVGMTVAYVVYPVLWITLGWAFNTALAFAIVAAAGCVLALYEHPEWYVIDAVGLLVASGSAAVFGISLGIVPTVLLLAALAIYDAIAVYRTKHMLSLADTVIELRLPVLLVIPKVANYRFRDDAAKFKQATESNKGEREAMFMGLGDLVMPTILVVSALHFDKAGWGVMPSLGAAFGTLVGFGILMGYVLRGRPQAGLPLLNGGSIVGFLAGVYWATGSVVFW